MSSPSQRYASRFFVALAKVLTPLPDRLALRIMFRYIFRRSLNLYDPATFNDWINWSKLQIDWTKKHPYVDKLTAKDIAGSNIGAEYQIPTLWAGEDPNAIPFDSLPVPFIVKTTHASGGNFICHDQNPASFEECRTRMSQALRARHGDYLREKVYSAVRPRIIVEPLLLDEKGQVPLDYKFFVARSKVIMIQVDHDRFGHHTRSFHAPDWKRLDVRLTYPDFEGDPEPPARLAEMVALAQKLSEDFAFVRIDLYCIEDRVYFGEYTFFPGGGFEAFDPPEFEKDLAARLKDRTIR